MQTIDKIQSRTQPLWRWLDERLGLDAIRYPVPAHANGIAYTLGGITLFGFVILGITGFYLSQFYHPEPSEARDSVIFTVTKVSFGEFVRSVHFWAANLVIITMSLHVVRVFMTGSFKRPREVNWLIGVGLLVTTAALYFSGTVLKWDQEGYEALTHNQAAADLLGSLGTFATTDFTVSVPLLTRLYLVHASTLAVVFILLVVAHLALVKRHGISEQPEAAGEPDAGPPPEGEPSHFNLHLRGLVGYGLLVAVLAAILSLALPATLGDSVTPGIEQTKPPWLFWWLYALENWWGIGALLWVTLAVPIALALVPFLDRSRARNIINRRRIAIVAGVAVLGWVGLTIFVWATPPVEHLG